MLALSGSGPEGAWGQMVLWVLYLAVFAGGIGALWQRHGLPLLAGLLALSSLAAQAIEVTSIGIPTTILALAAALSALVFFALLIGAIGADLMGSDEITLDRVTGAGCIYFLLGMLWATAYVALDTAWPGSFGFDTPPADPHMLRTELIYYSYVTLTTIGYGDIVPLTPFTRSLSSLEGVIGQLYLTITVARFVGMYLAGRRAQA